MNTRKNENPADDYNDFGSLLKFLRIRAGFDKLEDLARKVSYDVSIISKLENNKYPPPDEAKLKAMFVPALKIAGTIEQRFLDLADKLRKNLKKKNEEPPPQGSSVIRPPVSSKNDDLFIGREQEIEQILTKLKPGQRVTIVGLPGSGKTALAKEVMRRLTPEDTYPKDFPDGIIYYEFESGHSIESFYQYININQYFGQQSVDEVSARDVAHAILSRHRVLLVLESIDSALSTPSTNLEKFLEGLRNCGCGVLLTARRGIDVKGRVKGRIVETGMLPADKAREMLQELSQGRANVQATADKICELLGNWPLAILWAAHYIEQNKNADEYREILSNSPLKALVALDPGKAVQVALESSIAVLGDDARKVLYLIGCLGMAPFNAEEIAIAFREPLHKIRLSLAELVNYRLIYKPSDLSYQISHLLLRTYVQEKAEPSPEVIKRLAYYYIAVTHKELTEDPKWQLPEELRWWRQESREWGESFYQPMEGRGKGIYLSYYFSTLGGGGRLEKAIDDTKRWLHFDSLMEWALRKQEHLLFLSLIIPVVHYMERRGHYAKRLEYARKAVQAASNLEDKTVESVLRIDAVGHHLSERGNYEKAKEEIRAGVKLLEPASTDQAEQELRALGYAFLTRVYLLQGDIDEATKVFEEVNIPAECRTAIKERILTIEAELAHNQKDHKKAVALYEEVYTLIEPTLNEKEAKAKEFQMLIRVGTAYFDQGDLDTAQRYFERVLGESDPQQIGETVQIATAAYWLARVAQNKGLPEKACNLAEQAQARLKEFEHRMKEKIETLLAELKCV